jgi:hypothetical protein
VGECLFPGTPRCGNRTGYSQSCRAATCCEANRAYKARWRKQRFMPRRYVPTPTPEAQTDVDFYWKDGQVWR